MLAVTVFACGVIFNTMFCALTVPFFCKCGE